MDFPVQRRTILIFLDYVSKFDIVFLYETWADASSDIQLNGFKCHNLFRDFQHKNARRCSGGVALFYKESLHDGITIERNTANSVIWIKLNCEFFKSETDIFIGGAYIWPEDSPAYNVVDIDFFDILENDVNDFSQLGTVYIAGDFNSRVGCKNDYISHDCINIFDDAHYMPDNHLRRVSQDTKCNSFGSRLIDLCKYSGLRIVNGRYHRDYNIGRCTYVTSNGASVIDYLLTHEHSFSGLNEFSFDSINVWSNHAPVYLGILCNYVARETIT